VCMSVCMYVCVCMGEYVCFMSVCVGIFVCFMCIFVHLSVGCVHIYSVFFLDENATYNKMLNKV